MSELMTPIPFRELMTWITTEYRRDGAVFGVHKPYKAGMKKLPIFGETIETPFGPAAGPNTQLAQNIIAGYFRRRPVLRAEDRPEDGRRGSGRLHQPPLHPGGG